ncbi:E3 ubiquitin-protein ligase PRT6, partial [Ananas comosus]
DRKLRYFYGTKKNYGTFLASSINNCALRLPLALSLLVSTAKMVGQGKLLKVFFEEMNETIEPSLEPSLRKLRSLYYPHSEDTFLASERLSQSLFLWDTFRYSLISTEIAARGRMNPTSSSSKTSLDSLYSELNSSTQSARSLSRLEVLLRFKGIQLFMSSICSGVSVDDDLLNPTERRGAFSPLLKHLYEGETHPDIQFWKQSADPILAHDPFSSLMWVLFCIPLPFVLSSDFFFPLVHLFYVVHNHYFDVLRSSCLFCWSCYFRFLLCKIKFFTLEALLTCYNQENFDTSGFNDYVLHDICSTMSESGFVRQYFTSKYIDPSCHPKDMVRRFTFPYLRRCAVLWKLLQSPTASPLYDNPSMWGGANCLS